MILFDVFPAQSYDTSIYGAVYKQFDKIIFATRNNTPNAKKHDIVSLFVPPRPRAPAPAAHAATPSTVANRRSSSVKAVSVCLSSSFAYLRFNIRLITRFARSAARRQSGGSFTKAPTAPMTPSSSRNSQKRPRPAGTRAERSTAGLKCTTSP